MDIVDCCSPLSQMLGGLFFVGVGEEQGNVATPCDGYSYR